MKIGIVISTNDPEVVWNEFRFGNTSLKAHHEVTIFLISYGVEVEEINAEKFDLSIFSNYFTLQTNLVGVFAKSLIRHVNTFSGITLQKGGG